MKLLAVNELKGNEKLAKHIVTEFGTELMTKGTVIKPEYKEKLIELGIKYVYVDDSLFYDIDFDKDSAGIIREKVKEESRALVKNVLEKHVYKNTSDLEKICHAADIIIDEISSEEQLMDRVANIRRDGTDIYSHSINVCALATLLALKNGYDKDVVREVAKGCILHDIGLRYVVAPYEDIDVDNMEQKDKSQFRKHVIFGYDAVKDEKWISDIAKDIILFHHERNDGTGYPYKNNGNQLDDTVKIVEVCDAFDSMINGIGCRQMKIHEAVEYIRANSLTAFEKKFADQLLTMVAMYPVGTKVITSENEIGIVIKQNKECIDRPVIKIISKRDGRGVDEEIIKDMTECLTMFIVDTIE